MATLITDAIKEIAIEPKSVKVTGNGDVADYSTEDSGTKDFPLLGIAENGDTARGSIDYIYDDSNEALICTQRFQHKTDVSTYFFSATYQINHDVLRTTVENHVHALHEADAETGTIVWQSRWRIRKNGEAPGAFTAWTNGTRFVDSGVEYGLDIYDFGDIDISDTDISDMLDLQFRRAYDGENSLPDDYTGHAHLSQWDLHYKTKNLTGSVNPWTEG